MGKAKATRYLIHIITFVVTVIFALLSVVAFMARFTSPEKSLFITIMGLGMSAILLVNFILMLYWILRLRVWAFISVAAILLNFEYITSTIQNSTNADGTPYDLKVATYNIHDFGFGYSNFQITVKSIAHIMKDEKVDVICFQEFKPNKEFPLDSILNVFSFAPYVYIPVHKNGNTNLAVFSKYPITAKAAIVFPNTYNAALWVDLDVSGHKVRLFNNHLQTTNINQSQKEINQLRTAELVEENKVALETVIQRLGNNFITRSNQVKMVRTVIDTTTSPIILCGDFNDTPSSYVYHTMKGNNLKDGFRTNGNGYGYTYRNIKKILRIDYVMYSDELSGVEYNSPSYEWSDHNPVLFSLRLGN